MHNSLHLTDLHRFVIRHNLREPNFQDLPSCLLQFIKDKRQPFPLDCGGHRFVALCADISARVTSLLLAAEVTARNFVPTTPTSALLTRFMSALFGDELGSGFSAYWAEDCHEERHGTGTCAEVPKLYGSCTGMRDW